MTCFSLVLDHLHNYKEGSWKRVNQIIPKCKLKIFQLTWQDMCENHANVAEDIPSGSSALCLYAKASFCLALLCLWWPLLRQGRVVEESKQGGLLEIFIAVLLMGCGSIALLLILFQAKVNLIDETTVSCHIRAKL